MHECDACEEFEAAIGRTVVDVFVGVEHEHVSLCLDNGVVMSFPLRAGCAIYVRKPHKERATLIPLWSRDDD